MSKQLIALKKYKEKRKSWLKAMDNARKVVEAARREYLIAEKEYFESTKEKSL